MMTLKEGYRYLNRLATWLDEATSLMTLRSIALNETRTHKRNAANPNAEDYTEVVEKEITATPMEYVDVMNDIAEERDAVAHAISKAKADMVEDFDLDASREFAKAQRKIAIYLKGLLREKGRTTTSRGQDYTFNVEGNQTMYTYEVEVVTKENFDRDKIKTILKDTLAVADDISKEIERLEISTELDITPAFDVNDTLEDILNMS